MQIGQVARDEDAVGSMDTGANMAVSEIENVKIFTFITCQTVNALSLPYLG